jgi:hypothetical protein
MPIETEVEQQEESTPSTSEETAVSLPADKSTNNEPSMLDIARQTAKESLARQEDEVPSESPVPKEDKTKEEEGVEQEEEPAQGEETETEKPKGDEKPSEDEDVEADESVPFDQHPVWQKRTKEFNALKVEAEALRAKQRTPQDEDAVKRWTYHENYIKQTGIAQEDVDQMMSFLGLVATGEVVKAREALRPLWSKLSEFDETALPSDLAEAVRAGDMTQEWAEKLHKAQVHSKAGRLTGEARARRAQEDERIAKDNAIGGWEQHKRSVDLDYKPKAEGKPDGLWEFVADRYVRIWSQKQPKSAAEEVQVLEQAYKEIKASWKASHRPLVNGGVKNLTSKHSSSRTPKGAPKTVDDVVAAVAAKHGIAYNGRPKGS